MTGKFSVMLRTQSLGRRRLAWVMQVVLAPRPCRSRAPAPAPPTVLCWGSACSPGPAGQASGLGTCPTCLSRPPSPPGPDPRGSEAAHSGMKPGTLPAHSVHSTRYSELVIKHLSVIRYPSTGPDDFITRTQTPRFPPPHPVRSGGPEL